MYLSHINSLRALAILLIVAGHSIGFFSWREHPFARDAIEDLIADGAVVFIFISGYLFQHLSTKFRYSRYLLKKVQYVLIPYLIVSIPAIFHSAFLKNPVVQYSFLEGTSRAYQVLWFYLHGGAHINYPLWFIPVIFIYYLAAPVFMVIIRYPALYWLTLLLLPVSLFAHRPGFPNPDTVHSLIYFLSAYILGMFASQFRDKVDNFLEKYLGALLFLFVSYYLVHLFVADHHGNYHVKHIFSFEKGYIDWMYLQKIILAFLLLGMLKRYDSLVAEKLRYIGESSFGIYFLHAYVLYAFHLAVRWRPFGGSLATWITLSTLVVLVSLGITKLTQKIFGKSSRLLIGS
jgi:peptidoglycan/LPS O-acetylase OafA/YrhL